MSISFQPLVNRLRRLAGRGPADFRALAADRWEIAPGGEMRFAAALMLPGQAERVRRTEFGGREETLRVFRGEGEARVGPTTGYRFRDVDLVDGVLYLGGAEWHLRRRRRRSPVIRRPERSLGGALYETWVGNRWFGNWLMDDCETYPLAAAAGVPVTTAPPGSGHVPRYEDLLGMAALRTGDVHFDELILFDDMHNNAGRMARAADLRARLARGRDTAPVPGVFLLRGRSGDRRVLTNEAELAERLHARHGFRVLRPEDHGVDALLDACAGARIVAGVEGSHLVHGLAVMPAGGALLTIQPPDRVTAALKLMCDRLGLRFAVVVGDGSAPAFCADAGAIERTLDLLA